MEEKSQLDCLLLLFFWVPYFWDSRFIFSCYKRAIKFFSAVSINYYEMFISEYRLGIKIFKKEANCFLIFDSNTALKYLNQFIYKKM